MQSKRLFIRQGGNASWLVEDATGIRDGAGLARFGEEAAGSPRRRGGYEVSGLDLSENVSLPSAKRYGKSQVCCA